MASDREYKRSHPWLRFEVDLRGMPVEFWLLLGEARSKCEHLANAPMLPGTAEEMHRIYLAKGAAATTAIEGNTLTEDEVRRRIEGTLKLPASREHLGREIDNFVTAINSARRQMEDPAFQVSVPFIQAANKQILAGLELETDFVPGAFRQHRVTVGRYLGAPAPDLDYLVEHLCEWLAQLEVAKEPERIRQSRIISGILKAILAHLYLAWIHPFGDGNGRTARFVEFSILVSSGVPTSAAHLLTNHYNLTRAEYYRQLDVASRSGGDIGPFLRYAVGGFIDQLTGQLELLHLQHRQLVWRTHVDDCFPGPRSASDERQRSLVLALTSREKPVALAEVKGLTPALAGAYAVKTSKTLSRDLHRLESLGLIERSAEGFRARTEIVQAMLPARSG